MSRAIALLFFLFLFLLSCPTLFVTTSMATMRPLKPAPPGYTSFDPKRSSTSVSGDGSQGVESCLPKGLRHTSAPSRYINYQPLGSSSACSPSNDIKSP
ncbi:hypothetical protein EUGRSUZ_G02861 [Eucalyptus grandis]|uniref:Uncharacterized protein n=3 Tax=Eucalyptus TaxID=3932 RepID=A0ACC3K7J3_EUCGR|nr:hypothetical protein EUGRSUZ_G02861 [Eucalyptus grandis]